MIAPSVGPVHGVHASANAAPVSTGPPRPARLISRPTCHSRESWGTNGASTNSTPIAMITAPETLSAAGPVSAPCSACCPSSPSAMKITEKLATNARLGPITRRARISAGATPATAEM